MQIASLVAGYSLGEADILRRAMGKKKQGGDGQGAGQVRRRAPSARATPRPRSREIFDLIEHFAGYGFNKSHSAAYAWWPTRPPT